MIRPEIAFAAKFALLLASLFPLQADNTLAPVADKPAVVERVPHRGPGLVARSKPVAPLAAEDTLPQVEPEEVNLLRLDEQRLGAAIVLTPSYLGDLRDWSCLPDDPGFIVDDTRCIFAPARSGTWYIELTIYTKGATPDDPGTLESAYIEIVNGEPAPPIPIPTPPDIPPLPISGKRVVTIVHESADQTVKFTQLLNGLRSPTREAYIRDKGHVVQVLDKDQREGDEDRNAELARWEPVIKDMPLPIILIAEPTPTTADPAASRLIHKQTLSPDANADGILELIKKFGG